MATHHPVAKFQHLSIFACILMGLMPVLPLVGQTTIPSVVSSNPNRTDPTTGNTSATSNLSPNRFSHSEDLTLRWLYTDHLLSGPGNSTATSVYTIAPSFSAFLGSNFSANYTLSADYYSGGQFHDTIGHNARLGYVYSRPEWSFNANESVSISDSPLVETGQQTKQTSYVTSLGVAKPITNKVSVTADGSYSISQASSFNSDRSLSSMAWIRYQAIPPLSLRVGSGLGRSTVGTGANSRSVQTQIGCTLSLGRKLDLDASYGVEKRSYDNSPQGDSSSPIYTINLNYRPFEPTAISLTGSRSTSGSLLQSQAVNRETRAANLNQRILGHFHLTLGYDESTSTYIPTAATQSVSRRDRSTGYDIGISTAIRTRSTLSFNYRYALNNSDAAGFDYSSSQYSATFTYKF